MLSEPTMLVAGYVLVLLCFSVLFANTECSEHQTITALLFHRANKCLNTWPSNSFKERVVFEDVKRFVDKKLHKPYGDGLFILNTNFNRTIYALARLATTGELLGVTVKAIKCGAQVFSQSDGERKLFGEAYYTWKCILMFNIERILSRSIGDPVDFFPVYEIPTSTNTNRSSAHTNVAYNDEVKDPYDEFLNNDINVVDEDSDSKPIDAFLHHGIKDWLPIPNYGQSPQISKEIQAEIQKLNS